MELLFLLVPLVAAYGFFMGRASAKRKLQAERSSQQQDYFKGVDYLLTNNREQAVERLISYLNASDPTFETKISLGRLFRKRGEIDKAISMHERMLSSVDGLTEVEHEVARLELAQDFMSAGLFDRAEELLCALVEIPRQRAMAVPLLVNVYEREHDYQKALSATLSHREDLGDSASTMLADYYCQLAADSTAGQGEGPDQRLALLGKALESDPQSIRGHVELATLHAAAKDYPAALSMLERAVRIDPSWGLLYLETLRKIFPNSADPNYLRALSDLVSRTHSAAAMVELVRATESASGAEDAETLLSSLMRDKRSLRLFSELLRLREGSIADERTKAALGELRGLIDAQVAAQPHYSCAKCGFEAQIMFWQCPSCRRWETMRPKDGMWGD
ncbi:MAG: hypothetical protein K6A65_05130 [Succinivibrionaceae bacterium]|nr:hypothetical protein [Succinivibrionaceae bacterium]